MTGARQISLRMHAVFVSAGWLPRTEVAERSTTRRWIEIWFLNLPSIHFLEGRRNCGSAEASLSDKDDTT